MSEPMTHMDRDEQAIIDAENSGEITASQASRELRELQRDYADQARDSAMDAYDAEMERW